MKEFDTSSFADKILAASSLAAEGSEGEVEFAFTEITFSKPIMKEKIMLYAKDHSRQGFAFDGCLNIRTIVSSKSNRLPILVGGPTQPMEEKVRNFLVYLSTLGRLEDLVQYVLIHIVPKPSRIFYTQSEESEDLDPAMKERLKQLESEWARLPEFGRQLLTVTFLIESDNSYEIEVEKAEGPLRVKEPQAKEIMDAVFQSRLRLVRSFMK